MTTKELKTEAREKLSLNIHLAIAVYAIVFLLFVTLIALVAVACMCLGTKMKAAAIVMICYGIALFLGMAIISGIIGFAMTDFYIASYRCAPYNIRRLGDTIARSGVHKILTLNIVRTLLGFLLLLALIVPGVIYLARTSMANHLLIANPRMKAKEALKASGKVMSGKTGAYFALMMSMFGWFVLGVLTLGLGFIFIMPYVNLVKSVYYKRNLQGDRNVYKMQPQPVSPMPMPQNPQVAQQQFVAQQQQMTAQPMARTISQPKEPPIVVQPITQPQNGAQQFDQAARPIHIEPNMQPISSLNDSDILEMNETMRDFGSEPVVEPVIEVEVPEVPLKPVTAAKSVSPATQSREKISSKPMDDSNVVEIVKPLTTREANETNPYAQKIDDMFSGAKPQPSSVKHDYFGGQRNQRPDDFVTAEVNAETVQPSAVDAEVQPPVGDQSESVMSDEAFAEFMRNFDNIPTPQHEFVPLKARGASSPENEAATPAQEKPSAQSTPRASSASSASSSAAQTPRGGASAQPESPEDRAERMRREREERLNQLRKNRH